MSSASGDFRPTSHKNFSPGMSYTKTSMFKSALELCDVASTVIFCTGDATMMLVIEPNTNEYWIPSVKVTPGGSWVNYMAKDLTNNIFGPGVNLNRVLRFNKLWLPTSKVRSISHCIFEVHVNLDMKKKSKNPFGKVRRTKKIIRFKNTVRKYEVCIVQGPQGHFVSKFKGKIRWSTYDEIMRFHESNFLKSPEVVEFMCWQINKVSPFTNVPQEFTMVGNFMEINENVLVYGKNTIYEQIMDASGINQAAQEVLYKEFLVMSYPALYMSSQVFFKFLLQIGWSKDDVPHLYRSADVYNRGGISFREFLYFLAATEPGTSHGGAPAELRCRYIFRYLDTDKNNLLMRDEMRHFIVLVKKARNQQLDPPKIDKELAECYQAIEVSENHALTMSEFLRAVGELKIRGTSQIYRSPLSILKYVKTISERESRSEPVASEQTYASPTTKVPNYELATHSVKIQEGGTTINIDQYWNIENAASLSTIRTMAASDAARRLSADKFDQNSKSNELLKALRLLISLNKMQCYLKLDSVNFTWGQLDPGLVAKHLIGVCNEVKEIFKKEPRMLTVQSPAYILGDIHGNITDLLNFERIFWHVGPGLCPCNLLFLGDFVDRGLFGFEVICYLFAYKLQSPRKVFLLRGNHEIKRVQMQWTFEKELKVKFGDKLGSFVFNSINDVFDTLPLAAVIDGKVFCCHGGIPPPWLCPVATAINDIPVVLSDPQDQSTLAWELMWNDPVRSKTINDKIAMELLANEGFAVNSRRGTAHIFSVEALEKFLSSNGFSHLVRAHEVVEPGFYLQQKGHLVTVFSSSKYCGGQNVAACILADQGKLRVLRLEVE